MKLKKRFTLSLKNNLRFIPDEVYMRMYFKAKLHYEPDFENPKTFNEKLQWYKLNYHNPVLTQLADKYGVRSFVEELVGAEYLVPLYGVYGSVEEIDLEKLPEKFVLKCTHDSQSTFVCTDKTKFDFEEAKRRLRVALGPAGRPRRTINFIASMAKRRSCRRTLTGSPTMICSIFRQSGSSAATLITRFPTMNPRRSLRTTSSCSSFLRGCLRASRTFVLTGTTSEESRILVR